VTIDLAANGDFDRLPDQHRTCVYRVVQEALTNCVRHARADRIQVSITGRPRALEVSISDNGVGFEQGSRRTGLGLRGIEERVRELNGSVDIQSAKGEGTTLVIRLPVPALMEEVELADITG
jgi:signal transduction histidine kinase